MERRIVDEGKGGWSIEEGRGMVVEGRRDDLGEERKMVEEGRVGWLRRGEGWLRFI